MVLEADQPKDLAVYGGQCRVPLTDRLPRNGADCPWTAATGITDLHCCKNGRLRALQTTSKFEPVFEVLRVDHLEAKWGRQVGRYRTRGDATKAVANVRRPSGRKTICKPARYEPSEDVATSCG